MIGGDGTEGMVAGQNTTWGRWPSGLRGGGREPDRYLPVVSHGGQGRVHARGGEPQPDRVPRVGRAQPMPHQMTEDACA